MKKKITKITAILLVLALAVGLVAGLTRKKADAALSSSISEQAKVKILEIVPHKAYAELGYLIQGQEPIADYLYEKNTDPNADYPYITYKQPDNPQVMLKKNEATYSSFSATELSWLKSNFNNLGFVWDEEGQEFDNTNMMLDSALGPTVSIADISEQEYFKYIQVDTVLATELDALIAADPTFYWQYDLVYLATQQHWGITYQVYNMFTGDNVANNIAYSPSNDMSWKAAYELFLANKLDGIPLVIDATGSTQSYNLNVGKLALMVRQCSYPYFQTYVLPHLDTNTGAVSGSMNWSAETLRNQSWWPSGYNYNNCEELGILDKAPMWQDVLLDENVWVYRGTSAIIGAEFEKKASDTNDSMKVILDTYPDIYERGYLPGQITHGDVFRYLLNLHPSEELTRTAYVLEIQPISFFEFVTHEYKDASGATQKAYAPVYDASGKLLNGNTDMLKMILRHMGYLPTDKSLSNLRVEALCTSAFNALKLDLNNYEYIHIGAKLGPDPSKPYLNLDRNDDSLDGLYYTAEGDVIVAKDKLTGLFASDYDAASQNASKNTGSYNSGKIYNWLFNERTDISAADLASNPKHQLNWLYHNGKKVTNNNYKVRLSGNDITAAKRKDLTNYVNSSRVLTVHKDLVNGTSVNTSVVDSKSEMYKLLNEVLGKKTVVPSLNDTAALFKAYANSNRFPDIIFAENGTPVEYNGTNFVKKNASSKYTYTYKFKVRGSANTKYVAKVYLDINGDGIYREDALGEYESELAYDSSEHGVTIETNAYGYSLGYTTISFEIPEIMSGMIPWKFVLYQVNVDAAGNESVSNLVYTSKIGYSACEPSEKKDIYVLHIAYALDWTPGGKIANSNGIVLDNWSYKNRVTNLEDIHEIPSKYREFYKLLGEVKDYNINIVTVSAAEFSKWYDPNERTFKYHIETDKNTGAEVLVKDATASSGVPFDARDGVDSGEDKLSDIFDMVMMGFYDSYGNAFKNTYNDKGAVANLKYYIEEGNSVLFCHDAVGYNMHRPVSTWGYSLSTVLRDIVGMDKFNVLGGTYSNAFSEYSYSDGLKHGFTNMLILRQATSATSATKLPYNYMFSQTQAVTNAWGNYLPYTTQAAKINSGYITQYPFIIGDRIPIRTTHSQWCQLNLEDEEVMVWYTLDGSASVEGINGSSLYNYANRDGANNYYIYSKGNITYSGAGHQQSDAENFTADELKLFINTMVAAIKAANNPPEVKILNGSRDYNEKNAYVLTVDETAMQAGLEYHVFDPDIIDGSKVKDVKVFYDNNNNGTYDAGDQLVEHYTDDTAQDTRTNPAYRNNRSATTMLKGQDPALGIAECIKSDIYSGTYTEDCIYVTVEASDAKGRKGYAKVKIKLSELFNLD